MGKRNKGSAHSHLWVLTDARGDMAAHLHCVAAGCGMRTGLDNYMLSLGVAHQSVANAMQVIGGVADVPAGAVAATTSFANWRVFQRVHTPGTELCGPGNYCPNCRTALGI